MEGLWNDVCEERSYYEPSSRYVFARLYVDLVTKSPRSVHTPLKPHSCEVSRQPLLFVFSQFTFFALDLPEVFQETTGSQEAYQDPYGGAPPATQALESYYRSRLERDAQTHRWSRSVWSRGQA